VTLDTLNTADRASFVDALGWIFEDSPWVAARAWERRPFSSVDHLHAAMLAVVDMASHDEQLQLLRAHPDLGARARMSEASVHEQAGAGLDRLSPAQFTELQRLNATYRATFNFPFLLAVKGCTAQQVLDALRWRVEEGEQVEFVEALRQVGRIARFRLEELIDA
jgi:OHCU decarboxylase